MYQSARRCHADAPLVALGQRAGLKGGTHMDFVVLLKFRSTLSAAEADAALGRRVAWKYPEGIKMIAEYWPLSSEVQVVGIMAAESIEKIMEVYFEWQDAFDIDIYPAVSADEGLRIGPEVFTRLPRMQQPA